MLVKPKHQANVASTDTHIARVDNQDVKNKSRLAQMSKLFCLSLAVSIDRIFMKYILTSSAALNLF